MLRLVLISFAIIGLGMFRTSAFVTQTVPAAVVRPKYSSGREHLFTTLAALPTADEVSTDDFMRQLGHASQIIPALHPQNNDEIIESKENDSLLLEILSRQFSHSDGIRGFFAVYLTSAECLEVEEVPPVLAEAVRGADSKVMVPLACMNVIMPSAMTTIHQDPELKECASKTADNGLKILRILKDNEEVKKNCNAIRNVCLGGKGEDANLIEYWETFFNNYKYGEKQREAIAKAFTEFCN